MLPGIHVTFLHWGHQVAQVLQAENIQEDPSAITQLLAKYFANPLAPNANVAEFLHSDEVFKDPLLSFIIANSILVANTNENPDDNIDHKTILKILKLTKKYGHIDAIAILIMTDVLEKFVKDKDKKFISKKFIFEIEAIADTIDRPMVSYALAHWLDIINNDYTQRQKAEKHLERAARGGFAAAFAEMALQILIRAHDDQDRIESLSWLLLADHIGSYSGAFTLANEYFRLHEISHAYENATWRETWNSIDYDIDERIGDVYRFCNGIDNTPCKGFFDELTMFCLIPDSAFLSYQEYRENGALHACFNSLLDHNS